MICSSPESKFIQEIVEKITSTKVKRMQLSVAKYLVGVNPHAKVVELLLDIESIDVRMIGIQGLGRIGKTTIAKAVYNKFVNHFEASYFLEDVREKSKKTLLF